MSIAPEVAPRPAATVLLLRDGAAGPEVLMITRHRDSGFAAGALVFPGGRVDDEDAASDLQGCCRCVAEADTEDMAFRVAGIRETFEEAHLLLARPAGRDALLSAAELEALERRLAARLGRPPNFSDLAASGEVELATDLLVPFARWITPAIRPKRYDTRFFLAPAPADQVAAHDGYEAVASMWTTPAAAVAAAEAKRASLVFVTRMNLVKLARSATVAAALAAARADTIITICPEVVETPEGRVLRIPRAAGYDIVEVPAATVVFS